MIGNAPQLPAGLVFNFDALNTKCYSGSGTTFTEIISGQTGTVNTANSGTVGLDSTLGSSHLKFANPNAATRTAYISFPVNITSNSGGVYVPQGPHATWNWWHYFQDAGNVDHPNFGWETAGSWDGDEGFVFGTGYDTDGPRWGIDDGGYTVYATTGPTTGDYRTNEWQNYCVTFDGLISNGLKTYLNGVLVDERNIAGATNKSIPATNTNNLHVGATNSRGGNWNGYMDIIQMYETTLSASQVKALYNAFKGRF
jgi:hypothetical protein